MAEPSQHELFLLVRALAARVQTLEYRVQLMKVSNGDTFDLDYKAHLMSVRDGPDEDDTCAAPPKDAGGYKARLPRVGKDAEQGVLAWARDGKSDTESETEPSEESSDEEDVAEKFKMAPKLKPHTTCDVKQKAKRKK